MTKFALVGCGRIAHKYATLIQKSFSDAELTGVCDNNPKALSAFIEKFKVSGFSDMHEMMKNCAVDVVCVLTPSGCHAQHAVELSHYGKHVIVEKPMALTLDDATNMIQACQEAQVKLFVVQQNRFNLPIIQLKKALDEGRLGRLTMGTVRVRWCRSADYYQQDQWRGTWALDGGVLANQANHHIDLLQWMMGPVKSVSAMGKSFLAPIEAEDTAVAMLEFENGAFGLIEATTAVRPENLEGSLSIIGERGSVEVGGFAVNELKSWQFISSKPEDDEVLSLYKENPKDVYGFGHERFLRQVINCLKNGVDPLIDGLAGLQSVKLMEALYESMESGAKVYLKDFKRKESRLGQK